MRLQDTINIVVPVGALGGGIRESDVDAGIAMGAHAIACDAGSTDSGPAYLATGKSKYGRDSVKADLSILMRAQARTGLPLLIGSCGTSGCDLALDWTHAIAKEIALEEGLSPIIALLRSEQQPERMEQADAEGRILPLAPHTAVDPNVFRQCNHIVALMGPEPYIAALEAGADIVLGGRTTDTAVIAAVALMHGRNAGAAWHAGKTSECGGQCTVNPREGGVIVRIGHDGFEVEPLSADNSCSVQSVSAHMLYENSDPYRLAEPGGVLNVEGARYAAIDDRRVVVTGSVFEPKPYTMKLEGASGGGFQTLMLIGIQDPLVLAELDRFLAQMQFFLAKRVHSTMGARAGNFDISLRAYGWNAVSGEKPSHGPPPREIGLLFVATAETQAIATEVAKNCNPYFFHMPLDLNTELPSYAFPFSPAEIERGEVYSFRLNHVVQVDDPMELVRMEIHTPEAPDA